MKRGDYCEEYQSDLQPLQRCECDKGAVYELLKTGMVSGSAQVFTRYNEKNITCIRHHLYGKYSIESEKSMDYRL